MTLNFNYKRVLWLLMMVVAFGKNVYAASQSSDQQDAATLKEVRVFFDTYINTYNDRFGQVDKTATFMASLSELIHDPFIMSPPNSPPMAPQSKPQMTRIFDGFVQQLEVKGAVKLAWKEVNLQVLSANKVLANNIGYATNADGEEVYETISVYLVVRGESGWKIALFSPYEIGRKLSIKQP